MDDDVVLHETTIAAVDEGGRRPVAAGQRAPIAQPVEEVLRDRLARLRLDPDLELSQLYHEVDFVPRKIAPEVQLRRFTTVQEVFVQLRQDQSLEDGPALRMVNDLRRRANPEQKAEQPAVEKVELRALDQPLAQVVVVRAE